MKKTLVVLVLALLVVSAFASDVRQPAKQREARLANATGMVYNGSREVPAYTFVTNPTSLTTTYYDYQPGSYNGFPIRIQPTVDGKYIAYHSREVAGGTRRAFYSYVDANGNVVNTSTIGTEDLHEGYLGIDIDPVSEDPMVTWHVNLDTSTADLECVFTYDLYHLMGGPGLWKTPFEIINESVPSPFADDEYIWPYTFIGASPEAGKRRVYVYANNSVGHDPSGNPSENVMIAYADFDENDLAAQSELSWSYNQIDELNNWNQGIPEWIRPSLSLTVSDTDGTLCFMGYDSNDRLIAFVNTNYGEGAWDFYHTDPLSQNVVANPQNLDGSYVFTLEPGENLFFGPIYAHHMNTTMSNGKAHQIATMGLQVDNEDGSYYPWLIFPKAYSFDLTTHEFDFVDLDVAGDFPADGEPMLPWDLNNDGAVDEYDGEGNVLMYNGWPIYFHDNDTAFHENGFRVARNEANGWLLGLYQDGLKNKYAQEGDPNWADWAEVPEIAIVVSGDNGATWSEVAYMNSIDTPEFGGMIPEYVYPAEEIVDLGNGHGLVNLFFLDDNSFGSSIHGFGDTNGGTLMYASIDIDFSPFVGANNNTTTPVTASLMQNYPNPFNPTTEIAYELKADQPVNLQIFNAKGQLVKTLVDEVQTAGTKTVTWNGTDDNGNSVTSGVYFYKMKSSTFESARKMILMK
jgi:hypothetical protein